MATLTEGRHAGEFIISEANGHRSRDNVTVLTGSVLNAGHVVGIVTASGKVVEWNPAGIDGSENVAGVSFAPVDATAADKAAVILARDCEVTEADLSFVDGATVENKATAVAGLEGLGIIAR